MLSLEFSLSSYFFLSISTAKLLSIYPSNSLVNIPLYSSQSLTEQHKLSTDLASRSAAWKIWICSACLNWYWMQISLASIGPKELVISPTEAAACCKKKNNISWKANWKAKSELKANESHRLGKRINWSHWIDSCGRAGSPIWPTDCINYVSTLSPDTSKCQR